MKTKKGSLRQMTMFLKVLFSVIRDVWDEVDENNVKELMTNKEELERIVRNTLLKPKLDKRYVRLNQFDICFKKDLKRIKNIAGYNIGS